MHFVCGDFLTRVIRISFYSSCSPYLGSQRNVRIDAKFARDGIENVQAYHGAVGLGF
jgi:hypothetical protein